MIKIAKVFIVDDDVNIVFLFEQFLVVEGHEIVAKAFNGEEAIEIFKNFQVKPDLVLMDQRMPTKNGIETTKEILSMNPETKIIFISADYSIKNEAFEIGAIDFIEKPIDLSTLSAIINKHV